MAETIEAVERSWQNAYYAAQERIGALQRKVASLEAQLNHAKTLLKLQTEHPYQHG